jgi:hypothetical protein
MPITQKSKKRRMGRPAMVLPLVLALLLSPVSLLAQRGGGRGGRGTTSGPKGGVPETDEMKDFKRALALQATEPQIALFQILAKDMGTAKEKVGDLAKHPERTREQAGILAYVVENARDESHDFLRGLSDTQKSGLKAWKKKVEKADSDVSKRWKGLTQDIAREKIDGKRMAADAEKLSEALEKSLTEQWRLVGKMGIQPPPDGNHTGDGGAGDSRSTTLLSPLRRDLMLLIKGQLFAQQQGFGS